MSVQLELDIIQCIKTLKINIEETVKQFSFRFLQIIKMLSQFAFIIYVKILNNNFLQSPKALYCHLPIGYFMLLNFTFLLTLKSSPLKQNASLCFLHIQTSNTYLLPFVHSLCTLLGILAATKTKQTKLNQNKQMNEFSLHTKLSLV